MAKVVANISISYKVAYKANNYIFKAILAYKLKGSVNKVKYFYPNLL